MDVNEHERLFNSTLRHKWRQSNSTSIVIMILWFQINRIRSETLTSLHCQLVYRLTLLEIFITD